MIEISILALTGIAIGLLALGAGVGALIAILVAAEARMRGK